MELLHELQVAKLFQEAFSILEIRGYKKAEPLLKQAFAYNPYPIDIHYRLAVYFAQNKNKALFLYHLAICFDNDPSYLHKALFDKKINKIFRSKTIELVKDEKRVRHRLWQVMCFESVKPYRENGVGLKIKKNMKKNVEEIYITFPECVERYFSLDHTLRKIEIKDDMDRSYCGYEKVYTSIKRISPFVENVRFFMSSESMDWFDEVIILHGVFYSYRRFVSSDSFESRLSELDILIKQNPKDKTLKFFLAQQYLRAAISEIKYGHQDEKLIKRYIKKLCLYGEPHYVDYVWGLYYSKLNKLSQAKKYLLRAEEKMRIYDIYFILGQIFFEEGSYEKAQPHFMRAIRKKPQMHETYFYQGMCYEYQGKTNKAFETFQFFINQNKEHNSAVLLSKGNILLKRGFYKSAEEFYIAAITQAHQHLKKMAKKSDGSLFYVKQREDTNKVLAESYTGLAMLKKDSHEQLKFCNRALKINPLNPQILFNKGVVLQEMGKLNEAESCYDQALVQDAQHLQALNNKFILLYQKKCYEAALLFAKKMVACDRNYINGYLALGSAYLALKKNKSAALTYSKLIKLVPKNADGYAGLALAQALLGKNKFAKK